MMMTNPVVSLSLPGGGQFEQVLRAGQRLISSNSGHNVILMTGQKHGPLYRCSTKCLQAI